MTMNELEAKIQERQAIQAQTEKKQESEHAKRLNELYEAEKATIESVTRTKKIATYLQIALLTTGILIGLAYLIVETIPSKEEKNEQKKAQKLLAWLNNNAAEIAEVGNGYIVFNKKPTAKKTADGKFRVEW